MINGDPGEELARKEARGMTDVRAPASMLALCANDQHQLVGVHKFRKRFLCKVSKALGAQ